MQVIKDKDGGVCEGFINGNYCEIQTSYLEKADLEMVYTQLVLSYDTLIMFTMIIQGDRATFRFGG